MSVHAHGTRQRYAAGCRCNLCVLVHEMSTKERRPVTSSVPAGSTRDHILALRAGGLSVKRLAAMSGYSEGTIRNLQDGKTLFTSRFIAEDIQSIPVEVAA